MSVDSSSILPDVSSQPERAAQAASGGDLIRYEYGVSSRVPLSNLELSLAAFKLRSNGPNGEGPEYHFWEIVSYLWGEGSNKRFVRHPWAEKMTIEACRWNYLGIHGSASSGKSDWSAVWSLVNWMCDPLNTLVLVTSTSLKDSRKRIWGSVTAYYQAATELATVGKLVDSIGMIRSYADDGSVMNDKCGIALIPGEKKKEKEAIGKLIGMKNKRVFLIADELTELSEALISAAMSNLSMNPHFQLVGLGNFNSIYDPLGVFITPKNGWASVSVEDEEWETKDGFCIHLDGLKSPNVLVGEDIWPVYSNKNLAEHKKRYGENSALFWRMCRSFPCPEGEQNTIYSDADFILGEAHDVVRWLDTPIPVCAADPSFTSGGDEFSICHGLFGRNHLGVNTLFIVGMETVHEDLKLTEAGEARDLQTARQLAKQAEDRHVARPHLGIDCSGPGGLAFGSILSIYWGNQYVPIRFHETASELPVSSDDPRKGYEAFADLASEMWFLGRQFVRSGQIKGLPLDVARQLKSRYYETTKSGDFVKLKVEPKKKMRIRIGESCDKADAFLMLVCLCRFMFSFSPGDIAVANSPQFKAPKTARDWMTRVKKAHSVYENSFA